MRWCVSPPLLLTHTPPPHSHTSSPIPTAPPHSSALGSLSSHAHAARSSPSSCSLSASDLSRVLPSQAASPRRGSRTTRCLTPTAAARSSASARRSRSRATSSTATTSTGSRLGTARAPRCAGTSSRGPRAAGSWCTTRPPGSTSTTRCGASLAVSACLLGFVWRCLVVSVSVFVSVRVSLPLSLSLDVRGRS